MSRYETRERDITPEEALEMYRAYAMHMEKCVKSMAGHLKAIVDGPITEKRKSVDINPDGGLARWQQETAQRGLDSKHSLEQEWQKWRRKIIAKRRSGT